MSHKCTVAIIGYGPVGAAMANVLARQGVDVAVVEEHHAVYPTPRAGGLVAESMRLLQVMDLADELSEHMSLGVTFWYDIFDKDWNLVLAREPDMSPTTQVWENMNAILQPLVERTIRRENIKLGVREFTGYRAEIAAQDDAGVSLKLTAVDPVLQDTAIQADWVIGTDGSRSRTRAAIGTEVEDFGGDQSWLLVDLRVTDESVKLPDRIFQWAHPERAVTYIPPRPGNINLFEFRVMPGDTVEDLTSKERVWELLSPWVKEGQATLIRTVVYDFHSRIARNWRGGRVFLAGDAAHTMPPELAEGLNSGLRDVFNLGWKLGGVINGTLDESVLDTYQSERRPHVRAFTVMSLALAEVITRVADDPDADRTMLGFAGVFQHPRPLIGPGVHGDAPLPAGLLSEQPVLADGSRLDDVIGYHFAIVGDLTKVGAPAPGESGVWRALDTKLIPGDDPAIRAWLDRLGASAVVVRPDRLLLGVANSPEELAQMGKQLEKFVSPTVLSTPAARVGGDTVSAS